MGDRYRFASLGYLGLSRCQVRVVLHGNCHAFIKTKRLVAGILRAGRGKRRGRVRRTPRSLLVVTAGPGQASGFRNLPGVDVVDVHRLTTEDLAPGGDPGRVTIFSRPALSSLAERLEGHRP